MTVPVKKQPPQPGPHEDCVSCGWPTTFWWGNGHMPLCNVCASATNSEHIDALSRKSGYGPAPPQHLPPKLAAQARRRVHAESKESRRSHCHPGQ